MAGKKNSKTTVNKRVLDILPYVLKGHTAKSLWSNMSKFNWTCGFSTLRRYVSQANQIIESRTIAAAEKELSKSISRLDHLYFLSLQSKREIMPANRILVALQIVREMNELLKLKEVNVNIQHSYTESEIMEILKSYGIPIEDHKSDFSTEPEGSN